VLLPWKLVATLCEGDGSRQQQQLLGHAMPVTLLCWLLLRLRALLLLQQQLPTLPLLP
jgi:hypothetical protein